MKLVQDLGHRSNVMDVMKMGNIVPRVEIDDISLALRTSVLTIITQLRLSDVTTVPTLTCLCGSLPERSVQSTTLFLDHRALKCFGLRTPKQGSSMVSA